MRKLIILGIIAFTGLIGFLGATFTIPEGHVGIITQFGQAKTQVGPGFNTKVPFMQDYVELEVREIRTLETLSASSQSQQPIRAEVSVLWSINKASAIKLYREFKTREQFVDRILGPLMRQAAKAAIAEFNESELIRNRDELAENIKNKLESRLSSYPVTVHSPQIENLILPSAYLKAIEEKQVQEQEAQKQQNRLKTQEFKAQEQVQSAQAEADAIKLQTDARAYQTREAAKAEADAIKLLGEANAKAQKLLVEAFTVEHPEDSYYNTTYGEYLAIDRWNGALPTTMPPDASVPFLKLNAIGQP
ncbi:MAG: prohibitin family protein [Gammaproteobacteria bacterium]|nr:prohibitin family protein [Gammaproteobacteria bacterium]